MAMGAALPQGVQPPETKSGLQQYMDTYGQQLSSILAGGGADAGGGGGVPPGQDMGFDTYQANPQPFGAHAGQPPKSALAAADGQDAGAKTGEGTSFRDLWQKQSSDQRKEYIAKLQDHLDATNQTINTAYDKMMEQLGGRPSTDLSKDEKGMLLMEFGLHMMANSRGQQEGGGGGMGTNLGANIGQSGLQTMDTAKNLRTQKIGQQQAYDKTAQALTIAHGRDVTNLASRSALEQGRDLRAAGAQDASIVRAGMQQEGAGARNTERIAGAADRTAVTEAGKNKRAGMQFGQVTRTVTADDGSTYGLTKGGQMVPLKDAKGNQVKAAPGGSGGPKQTAAQANYELYMATFGKDGQGQELPEADMQAVREKALEYAANPKAAAPLTDSQMRQMSEKSADSQVRANPLAWAGMTPEEIEAKRTETAEQIYNRLKRNGSATSPTAGSSMRPRTSALAAAAGQGAGSIPTQLPTGTRGPNSAQLSLLQQDPKANAKFFLKRFGYLPKEYQQYASGAPQSALSQ